MIAKRYEFRGQQLTLREIEAITAIPFVALKERSKHGRQLDAPYRAYAKRGSPESVREDVQ